MSATLPRIMLSLTALLAVGSVAGAQTLSTSLPLTSIGEKLRWTVGDQNLTLRVPVAGPVKLEVYSPRVDPADYRSDTYYGDETYAPEQVTTTFTLIDAQGKVVATRLFTPGPHAWETLFDQVLPAGTYQLNINTQGNGKNTFAVRLAGVSAAVSADRLTVNVHSRDWVPALNVTSEGAGYVLRMYDGDGSQELEARFRDASGNITPLPVGADLAFNDLPVPAVPGQYTLELRQPATARQYSNSVGFSLTRAGQPAPLTVAQVDQTGLLRVNAELVLPTGNFPTQVNVAVNGRPTPVDGDFEERVKEGEYTLTPAPVPGADVSIDRRTVTVPRGGSAQATVQVRPQVALSLTPDKPQVCIGDTVTFTARATTAYAGELPLDLNLNAPALGVAGMGSVQSVLSADRPGELRVTGVVTEAGELTATAQMKFWGPTQSASVQVLPSATTLQLSRSMPDQAQPGEEITVSLRVRNTAEQPVPFTLQDQVGTGLEALDSTEFSGTLAPGEERVLTYQARVTGSGTLPLTATLNTPACPAPQQVTGQVTAQAPQPVTPTPEPAPAAPEMARSSVVTLPFDAPGNASSLVVAHALPEGATYVPGSARLDGQLLTDPVRGPSGTLYWVLPGQLSRDPQSVQRGAVSYQLAHTGPLGPLPAPALLARLPGERTVHIEGQVDLQDLKAARPITASADTQPQANPGPIKFPVNGSTVTNVDRVRVVVTSQAATEAPPLSVNGTVVDRALIGEVTEDPTTGIRTETYYGVPIRPGPNTLAFGDDQVTVHYAVGTALVEITPLQLTADGVAPLRLEVRAYDAFGKPSSSPFITLRPNLEVRQPDANPGEGEYQIRLVDGVGILELQPQSTPTVLNLSVLVGQDVQQYTYEVRPDTRRLGVGVVSATVGLDGNFSVQDDVTWAARGTYEGPLLGGKIYLAADKDGLPTDRDTLKRYTVTGDGSIETVPLQGIDPVAFTFDHPSFRVQYRQTSVPIDVLSLGEQLTALTAYSKTNPQLSGFVAMVPGDRITNERVQPEGTRILRLARGQIVPGSETLELVILEKGTGKELRRVPLTRNVDYQLDLNTGIVTLARALDHFDDNLNEQLVLASYRITNAGSNRALAFGTQIKYTGQHYTVGAAVVSLDGTVTYGARATYANGQTRADGLLAYSGGIQASADFTTSLALGDRSVFAARFRYQDLNYAGLNPFMPGMTASATLDTQLTSLIRVVAGAEYHSTYTRDASGQPQTTAEGGSVTARAEYRIAPFSVGAGLKYGFGDVAGLSGIASVGYHKDPLDVDITHTQPFTGTTRPETVFTVQYRVTDHLKLGFTDKYTWGVGHAAALTLDGMLGNINYAVAYDLPTAGGQGNRARFGVSTLLPLTDRLTAGLRGSVMQDFANDTTEIGAGVDLNYKTDRVSATLGTDVAYTSSSAAEGFSTVIRAGIAGSVTDELTLSADGLAEFGVRGTGQRLALGYAYRARNFNSLGVVRYVNGSLAGGQPELSSNLSAEYRQPEFQVRGYFDTRTLLSDTDTFTAQFGVNGTFYLTNTFGVGGWAHLLMQPSSQTNVFGYGLEATYNLLPGTWISAGYNFAGFDGLSRTYYTRPGFYLRLDLTIDETLGGQK
ncbi:hypothetical protein GCM10017782_26770 [Deinococcus ficus]|nr:hypothetical protein GCM10017782_26770 [Deinococcus ficus]